MKPNRNITAHARLGILAAAVLCAGGCAKREAPAPAPAPLPEPPAIVESASLRRLSYPTDRDLLSEEADSGAFQPTASGRAESALYGSVRTEKNGKALRPSFHEGIDITPLNSDRRGQPLDSVYAAAEGVVAYVNRVAGNSNYGKYVILVHAGTVGQLYTLYAHLSKIDPGVKVGQPMKAGEVLGVMGNTSSSSPIPMARAHLHFELGLIVNAHFDQWYRARKLKPDHGNFNGGNLLGIDPLAVFRRQQENPEFTFAQYMTTIPRAFEIVVETDRPLDFFRRYPALWEGPAFSGRAMVMAVSENGLPLRGWNAAEPDATELGNKKWWVRNVNTDALGLNGCRLVVCRQGTWALSAGGERWLEILTYP